MTPERSTISSTTSSSPNSSAYRGSPRLTAAVGGPTIGTSASILHDSGFNLTGAYGQRDIDGSTRDPVFWYAKVGYIMKGDGRSTAFSIDYASAEDVETLGDEFTSYGVAVVQKFDKIGTEFYLGVRNHELDRVGENFDDILAVLGGVRIKF